MTLTDATIARVRAGEIVHLREPREFAPLYRLLTSKLEAQPGISASFSEAFSELSWEQLEPALAAVVKELDGTREHYRLLAQPLIDNAVSEAEGLLH